MENANSASQTKFFTSNTYNGVTITQDTVSLATVAGYTADQLLQYKVIYFPPNPSSADLTTIKNMLPVLNDAMSKGKLVVAMSFGGNFSTTADLGPSGEDVNRSTTGDTTSWPDTNHPLKTGTGYGGASISSLGAWNSTWHSYFEDLTAASAKQNYKVVIQGTSATQVVMLEYKQVAGFVILDGMTSKAGGWGAGNTTFASNYAKYCLYAYDNYTGIPKFKPTSTTVIGPTNLTGIDRYFLSRATWDETLPAGTSVQVFVAVTDSTPGEADYIPVVNGGSVTQLNDNDNISSKQAWVKVVLSTTDVTVKPVVKNLKVYFENYTIQNLVEVNIDPINRFNNNEGLLTVSYDQSKGYLAGDGGSIQSFTQSFTPVELVKKPNPFDGENVVARPNATIGFLYITKKSYTMPGTDTIKSTYNAAVTFTKTAGSNV